MKVQLLIPSVYCESVIQVYIHIYRLQSRIFALFSYWNAKGSILPPPLGKGSGGSRPLVLAPLAVFKKVYVYQHGVLVVRAFASQSEALGSTLVESDQNI